MTQNQINQNLATNYQKQKIDFLDNLTPDDFRNGGSFNQAEIIIDEINKALYRAVTEKKEDPEKFIQKALNNLFRENSPAIPKALKLSEIYLEMRFKE